MSRRLTVKMKNPRSRFLALDITDRTKVVAEGRTAISVAKKAEKIGTPFSLIFVPAIGKRYIF